MFEIVKELICAGADGVLRDFVCVVSEGERVYDVMKWPPDRRYHWRYSVYPDEAAHRCGGPHYFAEFVALDDGRAISRDMQAPVALRRLGIPDAVILDMATHHVVVSSSSRDPELLRGETQTAEGAAVWRRLAENSSAERIGVDRHQTVARPQMASTGTAMPDSRG